MEAVQNLKKLGDAAYVQGRYLEAVENYNLALENINEDDQKQIDVCTQSALHSNRCMCYIKVNRIHEAWEDAQAALFLRPRWAKAHLRCAQCQELQGAFREAITHYQRAVELDISLKEEVIQPINALRNKLAQQLCHAIMLPSPSLLKKISNTDRDHIPPSPIYYASISPHPFQIKSTSTYILAAAYGDGAIRLWCTSAGALLQTLQETQSGTHSQAVTTLAWNSDGTMIASGSLDMTCAIWKLVPGEGDILNIIEGDGEIGLEFKRLSVLKGHSGRVSAVKFASFLEDNESKGEYNNILHQIVITASTDLSIKVWKINFPSKDDNRCHASTSSDPECLYTLEGHSSLVSDIDIDPIYSKILVSASGDAQFKLWNIENNNNNSDHLVENVAWESGPVVLCGFLPSREMPLLLTAHAQLARQEGRILLWDVLEKKDGWVDGHLVAPSWSLDGFIGRPTSWDACCYGSDSERSSKIDEKGVRLVSGFQIDFKQEEEEEKEKSQSILLAVACSDATVRVWEILNKNTRPLELFTFEIEKQLLSGSNSNKNDMPPWHAAALSQQQAPQNAFKIKFSPQGRFLAATGGDANQTIFIYSIQHGEQVCTLAGHTARIRSLEWSKDGVYLFSASEDGAVRKWKVKSEEETS